MKLLALDPGGATGFAVYKVNGFTEPNVWDRVKIGVRETKDHRKELFELFGAILPDVIVCEDFRLYPWKSSAQGWSLMGEARIIGAAEYYCHSQSIPLVLQSTGNRDIGYKWGDVQRVPKSNPANHAYDAEAHAVYYIIKNGGTIRDLKSTPRP